MGKKYGYARVSTKEQNIERQLESLENAGCVRIYEEKISSKAKNRPKFDEVIRRAEKGDTIVVHSLDRFVRSTRDLLNTIEILDEKGVQLKSLKEGEHMMDPSNSTGRFMITVISAVAELEYTLLRERQREGIAKAKEKGNYIAEEIPVPDNFEKVFAECYLEDDPDKKIPVYKALEKLELKKSTFYKMVNKYLDDNPQYRERQGLRHFRNDSTLNNNDKIRFEDMEKENERMKRQLQEAQDDKLRDELLKEVPYQEIMETGLQKNLSTTLDPVSMPEKGESKMKSF